MDLLALGNSAANFLLYCLMSTQFRATLAKMLRLEGRAGGRTTAQAGAATRREVGEKNMLWQVFEFLRLSFKMCDEILY